MKISPKQYAKSLYESVKDKDKKDIEQIIKSFVKILAVNNDINKYEKVVSDFLKIWNLEFKIVDAEITSANEIAKADINLIEGYIKDLSKAEMVNLETKLDKTLLGGVVMKYGDKILDGSVRTRLESLKIKMKN